MCKTCQGTHYLTLAIGIDQTYECTCSPSQVSLGIETSDVVAGLLKYNSGLTKYLAKYQAVPITQQKQQPKNDEPQPEHKPLDPYKSIIDIYNLKVLPPEQIHKDQSNKNKEKQAQGRKQKFEIANFGQQTSPRFQKQNKRKEKIVPKPKYPPGSNEDKIEKHMKQMRAGSRYLSNTGFKKYFGRECFENYGRENTTGVADGIVYNSYLKTFNITPHCGGNMPITQQTNRRALIAGDAQKYHQRQPPPETHYGNTQDRKAAEGFHKKPLSEMQQVIKQSQKRRQQQEKQTIKLTQPQQRRTDQSAEAYFLQNKITQATRAGQVEIRKLSPYGQRQNRNEIKNIDYRRQNQEQRRETQRKQERVQQIRISNRNEKQQDQQYKRIHPNTRPVVYQPQQKYTPASNNQPRRQVKYQQWEDDEADNSERYRMKKEILKNCYYDNSIAHQIDHMRKPQCGICAQRRYSKCCCRN